MVRESARPHPTNRGKVPMAGPTHFNLADPETILKWERELYVEVAKRTALMNKKLGLVGDGPTFVVQRQKEVFKTGGTRATITLRRELRQLPTFGNQVLRDHEEGLRTATFNYEINQIRQIARVETIANKEWQGVTSGGISVSRVAESTAISPTSPTLAQPRVVPSAVKAAIKYTVEVDGDWNQLLSEMGRELAEGKAMAGSVLTVGTRT